MNKHKILIVEDEESLLHVIKAYFLKKGYEVFTSTDGKDALDIFDNANIELVILDLMIPKINGFEVLKVIRSQSSVPVIIMTALSDEQNILKGYSLKADDYITKPLNPKVLVAKVDNLLSRVSESDLTTGYTIKNFRVDFATKQIFLDEKPLNLSKTGYNLLLYFLRNNNKTCSRELLLDEIWGLDVYVDDRIIDTYIKTLRKAIKPYTFIQTVFGIGYKFVIDKDEKE